MCYLTAKGGTHTCHARGGVVLASGGFQSNAAMAAEYQKTGTGLGANHASTIPANNPGDGITMTRPVDARERDMGFMVTVMKAVPRMNPERSVRSSTRTACA